MSFLDFFKSSKELEREKRRKQRANERRAERGVRNLSTTTKKLERERAALWQKAREQLQAGQKEEAAKTLRKYKSLGVLLEKIERQRMLSQSQLISVETAGDIAGISAAIADVADDVGLDPDDIAENFDRFNEFEEAAEEVDTLVQDELQKRYEKEEEQNAEKEDLPDDDELMRTLESEAAAEILGPKVAEDGASSQDGINEGRDKLRKLLEDEAK